MKTKERKGITLIALVLTIIVLLILAGISISMLTGQNGILNRAKEAKEKTETTTEKEQLQMAITELLVEDDNNLTKEKLKNILSKRKIKNEIPNVVENSNGSFTIEYTQKKYYIDVKQNLIIDKNLKISSASELKKFRDDVNAGNSYKDCYIYLENDLDLSKEDNWIPIGYYLDEIENNVEFCGIFDGMGNKIYGLNISDETERYHGLFGCNKGTIMNLNIASTSTICGKGNTGAIVGYNIGNVINCKSEAIIQSNYNNTGGIVGRNDGEVSRCINNGNVINSGKVVGGIVGWNGKNGRIEKCSNIYGKVKTELYAVGGIAGSNDGIITECFNNGEVNASTNGNAKESAAGGIAGYNQRRNNKMLQCRRG